MLAVQLSMSGTFLGSLVQYVSHCVGCTVQYVCHFMWAVQFNMYVTLCGLYSSLCLSLCVGCTVKYSVTLCGLYSFNICHFV